MGLLAHNPQIVEVRDGVGFGPQPDFAGIFERVIRRFDLLGAVVVTNDLVTHYLHSQLTPFGFRVPQGVCPLDSVFGLI